MVHLIYEVPIPKGNLFQLLLSAKIVFKNSAKQKCIVQGADCKSLFQTFFRDVSF